MLAWKPRTYNFFAQPCYGPYIHSDQSFNQSTLIIWVCNECLILSSESQHKLELRFWSQRNRSNAGSATRCWTFQRFSFCICKKEMTIEPMSDVAEIKWMVLGI